MKIVQINTFPYKATGSIMMNIHHYLLSQGIDSFVIWGRGREPENNREYKIQSKAGFYFDALFTRLTDKAGFYSKLATKRLIDRLDEIKPDIIHLHNIHGYYLNINMLWEYIKRKGLPVVWTFHDCWPFTGHCAYYTAIGCKKWINGCNHCPQKHTYPSSWFIDNSSFNYLKKKELFSYKKLTIVAPCQWMKKQVQNSFFCNSFCDVIYNDINLSVFKPTPSTFRKNYHLENKFIILGVASEWTKRKGLDDFIQLANSLIGDSRYSIVLIGINKSQRKGLPKNILPIEKINNQQEIAGVYSSADVFFNPSHEDNFPTVNLEAQACGLKTISYNIGGVSETNMGNLVLIDSVYSFISSLQRKPLSKSRNEIYSNQMVSNYRRLYMGIVK